MSIGNRIKTRRIQIGLSQEELAKKLGYKSRSTINKVELCSRDVMRSKVPAYAVALNTTIEYLMGFTDDPNPKEVTLEISPGERIKQARIAAGLTQSELAEKIGVKFSAIHKYENGIVVNLKRETIAKLASALNVKPSYLIGMDDIEESVSQSKQQLLDMVDSMTDEQIDRLMKIIEAVKEI